MFNWCPNHKHVSRLLGETLVDVLQKMLQNVSICKHFRHLLTFVDSRQHSPTFVSILGH